MVTQLLERRYSQRVWILWKMVRTVFHGRGIERKESSDSVLLRH